MVRRLAREEGLFLGVSSGAALAGALRAGRELSGGDVVVIFPLILTIQRGVPLAADGPA
ncbi:MAG: hypothetical protein GY859_25075 [Desulfobacterales bacterium]|nr:hypothetical protein [Desulfobacterales bacterium]